jgi:hypothetical protein
MFAKFTLDPVCKTVCWPYGADLAPEAIRSLVPAEQEIGEIKGVSEIKGVRLL